MKKYVAISLNTASGLCKLTYLSSPDVEFCAYSIPHPSEPKMNIRIQTYSMSKKKLALTKAR
jgi:DNA-directed RNA polymerase I and III subunit RPAC2